MAAPKSVPELGPLLARLETLAERAEALLPPVPAAVDWGALAYRWRQPARGPGYLQSLPRPHQVRLEDLRGIDRQKTILARNTRQFVRGLPANSALLWGARGTGKSSLIKALLTEFAPEGLRLIEVDKDHLVDLPDIVDLIAERPERFLVFCDDLSFEAGDPSYKTLKVVLDGSVHATPDNILVYATSNRRHLMPETMQDNLDSRVVEGELHPGEAIEEKVALSDRFGIWLSFYPFDQDTYLEIVFYWLERLGLRPIEREPVAREALRWALARGVRSGRSAWQFARDWAGRQGLDSPPD